MRCPKPRVSGIHSDLSEKEWVELSEMVKILECPHTSSVVLRKRDLISNNYLLHWKQVVFKLDKMGKLLVTLLINPLILRQKRLLMNEAFVAAVRVCFVSFCSYKMIL